MPRIAPFRKMFSRPVSSGWKPVPTSSRLATRPHSSTRPRGRLGDAAQDLEQRALAGAVAADDAEDLAGLRPSNDTSWSAQKSSAASAPTRRRRSSRVAPARDHVAQRHVGVAALLMLDAVALAEPGHADGVAHDCVRSHPRSRARCGGSTRSRPAVTTTAMTTVASTDSIASGDCAPEDRPAESVDDADHRVEVVDRPPARRHVRRRERDRRHEQSDLHDERHHVAEVAVLRRSAPRGTGRCQTTARWRAARKAAAPGAPRSART